MLKQVESDLSEKIDYYLQASWQKSLGLVTLHVLQEMKPEDGHG